MRGRRHRWTQRKFSGLLHRKTHSPRLRSNRPRMSIRTIRYTRVYDRSAGMDQHLPALGQHRDTSTSRCRLHLYPRLDLQQPPLCAGLRQRLHGYQASIRPRSLPARVPLRRQRLVLRGELPTLTYHHYTLHPHLQSAQSQSHVRPRWMLHPPVVRARHRAHAHHGHLPNLLAPSQPRVSVTMEYSHKRLWRRGRTFPRGTQQTHPLRYDLQASQHSLRLLLLSTHPLAHLGAHHLPRRPAHTLAVQRPRSRTGTGEVHLPPHRGHSTPQASQSPLGEL
jgi:hypothetical protein